MCLILLKCIILFSNKSIIILNIYTSVIGGRSDSGLWTNHLKSLVGACSNESTSFTSYYFVPVVYKQSIQLLIGDLSPHLYPSAHSDIHSLMYEAEDQKMRIWAPLLQSKKKLKGLCFRSLQVFAINILNYAAKNHRLELLDGKIILI